MLLTYTTLEYYGPCAAAAVGIASSSGDATMKASARLGAVGQSVASSPRAAMTRGLYMQAFGQADAFSPLARMKTSVRLGAIGKVNSLTQSDIAAAVWGQGAAQYSLAGTFGAKLNASGSASDPWATVIEGSYTAADLLRIIAAIAASNADGLNNGSAVFKSLDGTKTRVAATVVDGSRTVTIRDGTE